MNIIQLNTLHLNVVPLNGKEMPGEVVVGGGEVVPVPPTEPETPDVPDVPVEPKKFILSASVANGVVSATLNGVVVSLPYTANEGDTIVLEVTPNDGYTFEGWNDGNTDNPRSITMTADVVLSAQCVEVVVPPVGNYIQFEDKAVEAICVENWSSDGIGLTEEDAAAVTSIGTTFKGNTEITSFNEFEYFTGVTSLTTSAFSSCSSLKAIKFPSSVTGIGVQAFYNCSALEGDLLLDNVTTIEHNAFNGCKKLTSVYAPVLGSIPQDGFRYCSGLQSVELGNVVTSIGIRGLRDCTGLQKIIVRAATPPTLGADALTSTNNCPIYVPDASLEAYKTAVNWSAYADRIHPLSEIEGDNGVIKYDGLVGAYTFKGRSNEDADYDLVQDRSGNGNVMSIDMVFGREDNATGEVAGYCDYGIFMYQGSGMTTIPQLAETNTLSIIAKRVLYAFNGVGEYSAFFGATEKPYSNAVWLEYAEGGSFRSRNTKGEYMGRAETEIVWMTPTYMNGHRLTPTSERTMDGTCYLGRIRTMVNPTERTKVECLYIFNRELSPSEVESFIKEHIDADYVLPTIEQ